MDEAALKDKLPLKEIIRVAKFTIGLTHGWGSPFGLLEQARKEFLKEKPGCHHFRPFP